MAEAEAGGDTPGEADGLLGVGTVRSEVVSGVGAGPVPSVRVGGSDRGTLGSPIRSSRSAESKVERTTAAAIAPTSMTGARATVRGKRAHGESPAWVRPRKR